jgi:hypothetical protein
VSRALAKAAGTLLLAGALAACGRTVAPPPIATVVLEPAAAVRALVERERATETLTAFFRVTLQKPDGSKESSRGALVLRRPDALRLQIFSLGVLTAYDFTAVGDRYRVRLPLEGTTASGRFGESGGREDLLRYDLRPLFLGRERLGSCARRSRSSRSRVIEARPSATPIAATTSTSRRRRSSAATQRSMPLTSPRRSRTCRRESAGSARIP